MSTVADNTRLEEPNAMEPIVDKTGKATQVFLNLVRRLQRDPSYTLAKLPRPLIGLRIFVSDATGGGCPCYGDGTNFRRYSNDAIVS